MKPLRPVQIQRLPLEFEPPENGIRDPRLLSSKANIRQFNASYIRHTQSPEISHCLVGLGQANALGGENFC